MDVVAGKSTEQPFTPKQTQALREFAGIIEKLRAIKDKPVADIVTEAMALTRYQESLEENKDDRTSERIENIDELINAAVQYNKRDPQGTLHGFLEQVALVSDTDRWDERADRVVLMTLHSAKGLEFSAVIMPGLEEGLLPHILTIDNPDQVEEERRLCFVGMTRARQRLVMMYAKRRAVAGRYTERLPSSFLREIPPDVLEVRTPFTRRPAGWRRAERPHGRDEFSRDKFSDEPREIPEFPAPSPGDRPFKSGEHVRHEQFGEGVIMSVSRHGKLTHARIFFEEFGERTVVLEYVNLQRVED